MKAFLTTSKYQDKNSRGNISRYGTKGRGNVARTSASKVDQDFSGKSFMDFEWCQPLDHQDI